MENWELSKHKTKSGFKIEQIEIDIKAINLHEAYKTAQIMYSDNDKEFSYYITYTDKTFSKRGKHYYIFKIYRYKKII